MNNVATSNASIRTICPELIAYFANGNRASMADLARLHAAARCKRIFVRSEGNKTIRQFVRRPGESPLALHTRLTRGEADEPRSQLPRDFGRGVLSFLYRGT